MSSTPRTSLKLPSAGEDWRKARKTLQMLKSGPIYHVKANEELKAEWGRLRRQVVLRVGQITNDPEFISKISQQLIEIAIPSNAPPHDRSLYLALCSSIAKSIILQAEIEVTAANRSAIPLAQLAFNLLETLKSFPGIFWAKLVQRCGGWIIAVVIPTNDIDGFPWKTGKDYAKAWGVRRSSSRRDIETVEEYANRVSAIMRVYFHILKIRPMNKPLHRMFQMPRYWTWFARMMNDEWLLFDPAAAQLLYTALDVLGLDGSAMWGQQWLKMIFLIHQGITQGLGKDKLIGGESLGARTRMMLAVEDAVSLCLYCQIFAFIYVSSTSLPVLGLLSIVADAMESLLAIFGRLWGIIIAFICGIRTTQKSILPLSMKVCQKLNTSGGKGKDGVDPAEEVRKEEFLRHPSLRGKQGRFSAKFKSKLNKAHKRNKSSCSSRFATDFGEGRTRLPSSLVPSVIVTPCTPTDGLLSVVEERLYTSFHLAPVERTIVSPPAKSRSTADEQTFTSSMRDEKLGSDPPKPIESDITEAKVACPPPDPPVSIPVESLTKASSPSDSLSSVTSDYLWQNFEFITGICDLLRNSSSWTNSDTSSTNSFEGSLPYLTNTPANKGLTDKLPLDTSAPFSVHTAHAIFLSEDHLESLPYPDVFDLDMYYGETLQPFSSSADTIPASSPFPAADGKNTIQLAKCLSHPGSFNKSAKQITFVLTTNVDLGKDESRNTGHTIYTAPPVDKIDAIASTTMPSVKKIPVPILPSPPCPMSNLLPIPLSDTINRAIYDLSTRKPLSPSADLPSSKPNVQVGTLPYVSKILLAD